MIIFDHPCIFVVGRRTAADAWTVHARHAPAQPGIPAGDDHDDVHGDGVDYLSRCHHSHFLSYHSGLQSLAQFHNLKALATKTLLEQQTIAKTLLQASLQSCKFLITIMVFSTAHCVLCKVYFSLQPNKLRPILKFEEYYPLEHIFVPAYLSARKIHFFKF